MMASELRRIGIAPLRDIAWGTHLCCFVRTTKDLLALVTPYIKAGLESREYCIWVLSGGLTKNLAAAALRRVIPDLDRHLGQRSLDIVAARDWYLERGRLDRRRVIRNWLHRLRHAEAQGFAGMRAAGSADWLESKKKWKDFLEYEAVLNEALRNRRMIVLCSYQLATSQATDLLDVASAHQSALACRNGTWQAVAWRNLSGLTDRYAALSPRERQVLHLVAGAHTSKEIADRLSISVRTVEVHRMNLMRKLNVRNHIELLRYELPGALSTPEHQSP
jgi:DNA-binding CsgD family transcriptional regulator